MADFSKDTSFAFYENLAGELAKFDLALLVSNVGVMQVEYLLSQQPQQLLEMMAVNVYPQAMLVIMTLP